MGHYAKVDENNIVTEVIVATADFINSLPDADSYIKTSYNTQDGIRVGGDMEKPPLRLNYAGIGYIWMPEIDGFVPPKTFDSWTLNTTTGQWEPPIPRPIDENAYDWDEENQQWVIYTPPE